MKIHLRRHLAFILALLTLTAASSFAACAYYTKYKSIPSVKVSILTGELEVGDGVADDAYAYVSVSSSNKYYELEDAEWIDDVTDLKVGDAPRMQITLNALPKEVETTNYTTVYIFSGSYSDSNVTISNGDLLAADIRDSGFSLLLTVRIDAVSGTFDDPISASWSDTSLGEGMWETGYNVSGYYDVYLYRGATTVKHLTNYHGTSYNFYPYMTEAGDYQFKVRTVANPDDGVGKSSGWTASPSLEIRASQVSDGTGQTTSDEDRGEGTVSGAVTTLNGTDLASSYGWISLNGSTYFRYPDGQLATGWLELDDVYYRFDAYGRMLTGWFKNEYEDWFYLDKTTGAMATGWLEIGGTWYYFSTQPDNTEGVMATGLREIDGKYYYFDENGAMATGWIGIDDTFYYFYPSGSTGDDDFGYMAVNTRIGDFYVGEDGAWIQ